MKSLRSQFAPMYIQNLLHLKNKLRKKALKHNKYINTRKYGINYLESLSNEMQLQFMNKIISAFVSETLRKLNIHGS